MHRSNGIAQNPSPCNFFWTKKLLSLSLKERGGEARLYFKNGNSGPIGMIRVGLIVMWLQ